jgi:hypothetical protein
MAKKDWRIFESNGKYRIGYYGWFGIINYHHVCSQTWYVEGSELPLHMIGDWPFIFETINKGYAEEMLAEMIVHQNRVVREPEWKEVK